MAPELTLYTFFKTRDKKQKFELFFQLSVP